MKAYFISLTSLALLSAGALADDNAVDADSTASDQGFFQRKTLTGDWYGERTSLEDEGVSLSLTNIFDIYDDISGAQQSGTTYFNRFRATINLDLEKLVGFENATFSIGGVTQEGHNYNRSRFGILTNPSSIEGSNTTRLANIWLEQTVFDNLLTYRIGKVDAVGAFGAQEYGSTFMNDELAYIPNILFGAGLPFDPAQQLGAIVTLRPFEESDLKGLYVKAGVFNTNDLNAIDFDDIGTDFTWNGPVGIAGETGYNFGDSPKDKPGFVKAGFQYNFGDFTEVLNSNNTSQGNALFYANAGKTLYLLNDTGDRHVDGSISFGYAPKQSVNVYQYEMTALLRAVGPFAERPYDEVGIGFIAAWLSDDYSQSSINAGGSSLDNEFTIELTYKAQVTPWFVVQPDFQIVVDPGGNSSRDPVYITGLRTVVSF